MATYQVTSVDKFHGRNAGFELIELDDTAFERATFLASELRRLRILSPGQRVASYRRAEGDAWHVFPANAPGLTTGLHSVTLTKIGA